MSGRFRRHFGCPDSLRGVLCLLCALATLALPRQANALRFRFTEEFVADLDATVTYAAAWRMRGRDTGLLRNVNADDGNRNFRRHDMSSNRFTVVPELDLHYRDYGTFVRARAFYDFAYAGRNANDSPETNNNGPLNGGPLADHRDFTSAVARRYERDAELLDAYLYGMFRPAGRLTVLRAGRQVISWGESRFIRGISSAQSPVDATLLNVPGVQIKEVLLPVNQMYGQIDVLEGLTVAAYYQFEWRKTRLDEAGAYFSTNDYLDDGGYHRLVGAAPSTVFATADRVEDVEPRDNGQWGIALRFLAAALNDSEFGLYFINYHDKGPQIVGRPDGGTVRVDWDDLGLPPDVAEQLAAADASSYFLRYAEDVRLYGLSVATDTGRTSLATELSYRQNLPVQVVDTENILGFVYEDADAFQFQVSALHRVGPTVLADSTTLTAELGLNRLCKRGDGELLNDPFAWGYTVVLTVEYFKILPGLDVSVPLSFRHNVSGVSSVSGTFAEGRNSFGAGVNLTYRYTWKVSVGYTEYVGGTRRNALQDRGFLSSSVAYSF